MDKKATEALKKFFKNVMIPDKLPSEITDSIMDYVDFRQELVKESDRGCALLAASHLDFLLTEVLRSKLIGSKKHMKLLFDFNGALGTFSAKIMMCYSIGLICKMRMGDLQTIRKIRNEFGHSPSIISFEDEKVKKLADSLKFIRVNKSSRSNFITSVSFISGNLFSIKYNKDKFKVSTTIDENDIQKIQDESISLENYFTENFNEKGKSKKNN